MRLAAEKGLVTASWTLSSVPTACFMLEGTGPWVPKVNQTSCPEHEGERRKLAALPEGCPLRVSVPRKMDKGTRLPLLLLGLAHLKASTPGRHGGSGGGAGRKLSTKAFHQHPVRGWNQTMCGEGSERTCYFFHILQEPTPCGPREHLRLPKVNQRQSCPQGTPSPTGETDE